VVFVVSGPSGSGKTTLIRLILSGQRKRDLVRSVSLTTRPRRTGERHGRDYFFISKKEFLERLTAKKILEWTRYLGYYYATSRDFVEETLRSGRHVVLCLDYRGVTQIRKVYADQMVSIFILPPSVKELQQRIRSRCCKTCAREIRQRIVSAKEEIARAGLYDYRITNTRIHDALRELRAVMNHEMQSRKERFLCPTCRTSR
jgi:guanylate kinase